MYLENEFKPDVVEWGQKGELELDKVLEFIKDENSAKEGDNQGHSVMKPAAASVSAPTSPPIGTIRQLQQEAPDDERVNKQPKPNMAVEEYEEMLDAEYLQGDLPEF